ncbi:hypothetical protein C8E99_1592 [Citricoccus muralis]|uniref:Uncharacterized protein n=1 Tax=Citricoccus muralis TaxID=169134 RepID=A0A3D9LF64_9MICC|nr:hypothetical protein C8E99_1592 [Citricoccus muralis]
MAENSHDYQIWLLSQESRNKGNCTYEQAIGGDLST